MLCLKHGGSQLLVDVAVFVALVVLVGQVLARAVARQWPTYLVPVVVPVLRAVELIVAPIVSLGRRAAAPFERRRGRASVDVEREALHDLLREGELEGVGEREEIAIISGVVEFGAKRVRDVMTPRADIFALDDTLDARTLAARIAQSNYSRVPIYHGTLDDVRGMVHAFDVLKAGARSEEHTSELQSPMYLVCRLLLEKKKASPARNVSSAARPAGGESAGAGGSADSPASGPGSAG